MCSHEDFDGKIRSFLFVFLLYSLLCYEVQGCGGFVPIIDDKLRHLVPGSCQVADTSVPEYPDF